MLPSTRTGSATGFMPKTRTVPDSARSKPRMCLISVVFPAPFSPTRPNTLPRGTSNETSFKASFEPNFRDRFAIDTGDSGTLPPALLASSPDSQCVLHEAADLVFSKVEGFEPVYRGVDHALRLLH